MISFSKRQLLMAGIASGALMAMPGLAQDRDYVKRDKRKRTNLLLITADDIDWTALGFMNGRRDLTPNLDRLASQSHVFEQVRTVAPICMPSRQAFMSGLLPHRNGGNGFFPMHEGTLTLCSLLASEGYYCAASHKIGHMQPATSFPWHMKQEGKDRHPMVHADLTRLAITQAQAQYKPFFINCNINDPHRPFYGSRDAEELDHGQEGPYRIPNPLGPDDVTVPANLEDLPEIRQEIAQYWNSAQRLDIAVGNILKALEESGAADDTIVLFVSDHGMPFPFAKATCYDHGIRTPVVLRWPGMTAPRRFDNLASNLDILPTLLELLGIDRPVNLDGHSWVPLMKGAGAVQQPFVMSYVDYVSSGWLYPSRTLQDQRYALHFTAWADGKTKLKLESMWGLTYPAMAKAAQTDARIAQRVDQYIHGHLLALYDMQADPGQRVNLIDDEAHRPIAERMKRLMLQQMERTLDPQLENYRRALRGEVPVLLQNPQRYRIAGD
ncbi:N-sulfoglucosamine sulfohydrolase [Sphingobium sp. B7D2B]|uniref:sulfatase family protein n=1 Tax=Sphingobium sp. B7D2B TaxID=2940583 RepID=UPI0022242D87|nr:sulfatase [Sphingobium sp. B7D2B]MCW2364589.1 N-sulfoglucosamine sulfohydrolase [Sphingobium sp. B7D2B]